MNESYWCLGLMSGTSLDGIDAALIRTDGESVEALGAWLTLPYPPEFQKRLHQEIALQSSIPLIEHELTIAHAHAVKMLLEQANLSTIEVRVVGFHGQTIFHKPELGITWQIGNGALLAELTGIDVVCDFRRRDMAAGGQGAPLVPLYHAALAKNLPKPLAVVNIGGVANMTYLGGSADAVLAFDTGPGNALLNDWVQAHSSQPYDIDGKLAAAGIVHEAMVAGWLNHGYFNCTPPKSLDRNCFSEMVRADLMGLGLEDGAATLTAFTAASIAAAIQHLPQIPLQWLVCGGGRHNEVMLRHCAEAMVKYGNHGQRIVNVDTLGWRGDAMEAEAFAFLAMRSLKGLSLSLPSTTGVSRGVTGGAFYRGGFCDEV